MIADPSYMKNDNLYQLMGRVKANSKQWSSFKNTTIYTSRETYNRLKIMESNVNVIATIYNQKHISKEEYREDTERNNIEKRKKDSRAAVPLEIKIDKKQFIEFKNSTDVSRKSYFTTNFYEIIPQEHYTQVRNYIEEHTLVETNCPNKSERVLTKTLPAMSKAAQNNTTYQVAKNSDKNKNLYWIYMYEEKTSLIFLKWTGDPKL